MQKSYKIKISPAELKELLIEEAVKNSIDLIGFAEAVPFDTEIKLYKQWLEKRYNADMVYLERNVELRKDVRLLCEGARSVIVIALSYFHKFNAGSSVRISRYAWSYDYHTVVAGKLQILKSVIEQYYPASRNVITVDTKPILEKQWAIRAGIGWQGKNSLVIHPKFGSYLFLGTIVSSVEFPPSQPMSDLCGNCRNCIDSCKTNAIIQEKVIDCNKCLSYLTLERKDISDIPDNFKELIFPFLFGCDDCQTACPFNCVDIPDSANFKLLPQNLDYEKILEAFPDKNKFKKLYRNTSIYDKRKQIKNYLRNIETRSYNYAR